LKTLILVNSPSLLENSNLRMKITYFGHSCFQVDINGKKILFDPFISPNPLAAKIDIKSIQPDYILISHGHYDHIADVETIAQQSNAQIICSWEISEWLSKKGMQNIHPMNIGGKWMCDFGKVKCVAAIHSSSLPDGSYGGSAMGFIIETSHGNFYYSGDTALTYDMKLIGEFRKLSFALLPLGDNFTMGVDNAVIASDFIKCNTIIGLHYDTFDMIKIDKEDAFRKFEYGGKKLILIEIGNTIEL
jgi:L-ascorbate metabolism protein UlaG (beta-lactamase superfamily)